MRGRIAALMAGMALLPLVAAAQGAPPANGGGPMTVERVHSGFVVTPEVKVTQVDRRAKAMVGATAGWLHDQTFFIGGAGYVVPERSRDRQFFYGGLVIGVQANRDRAVGFALRGLFGGGRANSELTLFDHRDFRVHEDFVVAEPEASVLVKFSKHVRLTAGAGYRFVGRRHGGPGGFDGATGSIGLQIG